jgi:mono/diheme cytochrome c family protein
MGMTRRLLTLGLLALLAGLAAFWVLTAPKPLDAATLPQAYKANVANGERLFHAGGCASCHAAPDDGKCDNPRYTDHAAMPGGRCLKTPFGTFIVPNISSDKTDGIGAWTDEQFVNAVTRGISPSGEHYYPAFPFTSYSHMMTEDVLDLRAYLATLPAVAGKTKPHELPLPFQWRRVLGGWKLLNFAAKAYTPDSKHSVEWNRGAYLVAGAGHCAECHTPRDPLGGSRSSLNLAGGPNPEGQGWIPNITQSKAGLAEWSKSDIASYLGTGFTPTGDTVGGSMVAVQGNLARLPAEDRLAIAEYLKSLPAVENPKPKP